MPPNKAYAKFPWGPLVITTTATAAAAAFLAWYRRNGPLVITTVMLVATADRRLHIGRLKSAKYGASRFDLDATINRTGVGEPNFTDGDIWLSPNGDYFAFVDVEMSGQVLDFRLRVAPTTKSGVGYNRTDVAYPSRVWSEDDTDAPPFLKQFAQDYHAKFPDDPSKLVGNFVEEPLNNIALGAWLVNEPYLVVGKAVFQIRLDGYSEYLDESVREWWRIVEISGDEVDGIEPRPAEPVRAERPLAYAVDIVGGKLVVDGVAQNHPALAAGVTDFRGPFRLDKTIAG